MRSVSALAALLLLATPALAGAAEPPPPEAERARDTARARALFDEAGALERQGKWAAAQDRLRQALRLRETPQLHYALGWALENDDKLLEARSAYDTALRLAVGRPDAEEAQRLARERLADLDRLTPLVRVEIAGDPARTRVQVDAREARREDDAWVVAVNPGSHVLRVERSGEGEALEQMVYVGRSTVRRVTIDAPAVAGRDSSPERHGPVRVTQSTAEKGRTPVLPWVLVGTGAALLAGSAGLLVASHSDAGDRDLYRGRWCTATACTGGTTATRPETPTATADRLAAADAADRGNGKQTAAWVLGGAGIVSAAVGAFLLLRDRRESTTTTTTTTVGFLPGGALASTTVRF